MENECTKLLEPRYWGIHDLMVRLFGACTCECEDRVSELYTVERARGLEDRLGA